MRAYAAVLVVAQLLLAAPALAQQPPHQQVVAAGNGTTMEQGGGAITTRANVRLSLESITGTSNEKLQAIGHAVTAKMGDIRACYDRIVAARATVTGTLRLRIALAEGRQPATIDTTSDEVHDDELVRCALTAVRSASLTGVSRPAQATVVLFFDNSAARGTAMVQQHREQTAANAVTTGANGEAQAHGTLATHDVEFTVTGVNGAEEELVGAVHRGVTDNIAGLMDCRRRAGRRESPAGELVVSAEVRNRDITDATSDSSTVADTRAPTCVVNALKRMHLPEGTRHGHVQFHITFRAQ